MSSVDIDSFAHGVIDTWNSLDESIIACNSISGFNPQTGDGFFATYTGNGGGVKYPHAAKVTLLQNGERYRHAVRKSLVRNR